VTEPVVRETALKLANSFKQPVVILNEQGRADTFSVMLKSAWKKAKHASRIIDEIRPDGW